MSGALLILTFMGLSADSNLQWGPWSVSERHPVVEKAQGSRQPPAAESSLPSVTIPFVCAIRFFQVAVSPADGPRCQMYPTCSQYGLLAFRKHGPLMGFFMTADRLMRDNISAEEFSPPRSVYGVLRFYDPVEDNDFWWVSRP